MTNLDKRAEQILGEPSVSIALRKRLRSARDTWWPALPCQ